MPSTSKTFHLVYAIVGADRSLCLEALDDLIRPWSSREDFVGPTRVEGSDAQLADVLDEVRMPSLLGDHRVVVVDDADSFISAHRQALEKYCSNPSDTGTLILLCVTLPKNTKLYKIIADKGKIIACEPPKGRTVIPWVVNRARERYGKRLSARGAQMLQDHLGDAPGILDAELAKLATYVGQRAEISPSDIEALTGHQREEKVFAVTDAISSGDPATALRQWEQVLATDRAAPGRAIGGLAWGVRRLLEARRNWEEGVSISDLTGKMFTDPATLRRRLEGITTERLEEQQRDLLAADLAVKTGGSTLGLAIEKFIVKHSVSGGSSPLGN